MMAMFGLLNACDGSVGWSVALLAADLPAPPAFEHWVLERPLPLALTVALVGVAAMVRLAQRGQIARGGVVLGVAVALGGALLVIGAAVRTDREAIQEATRTLIRAVAQSDVETVGAMLDDRLVVASAGAVVLDEDAKREALRAVAGFEWFEIDHWSQRPEGAVMDGADVGRTRAVVRASSSNFQTGTIPMTWEFTWGRAAGNEWRVTRIELLTTWGQPPHHNWIGFARLAAGWAESGRRADYNRTTGPGFPASNR